MMRGASAGVLWIALAAPGCIDPMDGPSGVDTAGDDWDIDDPPRYELTDETLPRVEVPDDETQWPSVPLPPPQMGMDRGEPGILYSAALMGYYQLRMLSEDVGFHYEYDPIEDRFFEDDCLHRKAVSAFSLTWLYKLTGRDEFRFGAERVFDYLVEQRSEQDDGTWKLVDLGGTSLISMGLNQHAQLTGTDRFDEAIGKFGEHLLSLVNDDGSLRNGGTLYFAQAHLGLWRLYDNTRDPRYLEALEKVARFHYEHRDDEQYLDSKHLYALWAHEALAELYAIEPRAWIAEFAFDNSDAVVAGQWTPGDEGEIEDRLIGSFIEGSVDRQWRAILKLEGTIDAWRIADMAGDELHRERYRRSVLLAVRFLQGLQFRAGDTEDHPDSARAIGGVPYGYDEWKVRIEVPGHLVNALAKVVEYMDLEDYPGLPQD